MEFPKIHKIVINDFSLYKLKSEIILDLNDGVFCLAGANGLGKSTFISILSYALIGIVVDPKKNFASSNQIPKFFKENEKYAENYFSGRIDESKRDLANVSIEFSIGNFLYRVKRNFFDTSGLIEFSRIDKITKTETIDQTLTESNFLFEYKEYFTKDVGVATFEQYAFIQSFVLTFDESKKLIFWDASVMSRVLYLFFGIEPEKAELADELRKKVGTHGSNTRNIQWTITQNERTLAELTMKPSSEINIEETEILISQLKEKEDNLNQLRGNLDNYNSEIKDCELNISDISIKILNLNRDHELAFNRMYSNNIPIDQDEEIISILRHISQKILENEEVFEDFENLKERIYIVSKQLKVETQKDHMKLLKDLDNKINTLQNKLKEFTLKKERLEKEFSEAHKNINTLSEMINKFKTDNEKTIEQYRLCIESNLDDKIVSLRTTIEQDKLRKDKETKLRDEYKEKLIAIEKEIRKYYYNAERTFLPIFKKYANSFIGLDIEVELKSLSNGINLILKVNNTERTNQFQLSESQKYFIDIALRFALIEISSSKNAAILIDTPEGSLDIAYESRAGKMFGDFVQKGFDVVMTANINSSELLLKLADKCKKEKMKIERMTLWTELSTVQQEEQEVIEKAFNKIEGILNGNA